MIYDFWSSFGLMTDALKKMDFSQISQIDAETIFYLNPIITVNWKWELRLKTARPSAALGKAGRITPQHSL